MEDNNDYELADMLEDLRGIADKMGSVDQRKGDANSLIDQLPEGAQKEFFKTSMKEINSGQLGIHNMNIFAKNLKKFTDAS